MDRAAATARAEVTSGLPSLAWKSRLDISRSSG